MLTHVKRSFRVWAVVPKPWQGVETGLGSEWWQHNARDVLCSWTSEVIMCTSEISCDALSHSCFRMALSLYTSQWRRIYYLYYLILAIICELQYQKTTLLLDRKYRFSKNSFLDKPLLHNFSTSDFVLESCLPFWSAICWVTFIGRYPMVS